MLHHHEVIHREGGSIIFPSHLLQDVFSHCRRKIDGRFLEGESRERKAFGLIAGRRKGIDHTVVRCFPLLKNVRRQQPYKKYMDAIMAEYAIPSETPLTQRGWIAEPHELVATMKQIQQENLIFLGAYHMHRVPWPDDPLRDRPTILDTVLGADSRMLIFIISMIDVDRPLLRAFYEGKPDIEVPVHIKDFAK